MSGDVQPRKRKDKRRKREDEPREQHQGVHGSKMGSDDVHLHVQGDHETGGHWCAKIFFFSLLAILLGLVGLIILENRGLSDLDTPLSESRFSNYFDGWVDEHRESHDEHDAVSASIEEHEHDDEPFEEEEDHSEVDEAEDDDDTEEEKDHDHEDDGDDEDEDNDEDNKTKDEEDEDDDGTEEIEANTVEDDTQEDDNETAEDEEDDEDNDKTVEEAVEAEDPEEENNANDNDAEDNDSTERNNADDDDDDDVNPPEAVEPIYSREKRSSQQASNTQNSPKEDNNDDEEPFEEEDDDGTFESLESVVDNDAEELLLLQQKARQQQEALKRDEPQQEEERSSFASSIAVKIGVGVALALVARLVLIRKNPNTNESPAEVLMKRRMTMASPEDTFPEDADELLSYEYSEDDLLNRDHDAEEEYIEEEIEEEEEIEVTDEEYEEKDEKPKYVPQTFEQFNAMYRPKGPDAPDLVAKESPPKSSAPSSVEPIIAKSVESTQHSSEPTSGAKSSQLRFGQYHREETPPPLPAEPKRSPQLASGPPPQSKSGAKNVQQYPDEPDDEIEYDDDELYDEEMLGEEEEDIADDEGDEEDLSDIDDSELMNRLEAKYGRLPAREYDSDDDVDDQSWTKIKARGGGPQSMDDEAFDEELRRANEEMLRESFNAALAMFESLSRKFPDKPGAFLGKAKALDKLSEFERSNLRLNEAIQAYKRYLAFGKDIADDREFTEVAERCVDRMRFIGQNLQAVPIHEMLIERYPNKVLFRNQLTITFLMVNRLSDAKLLLEEILARWPTDGLALVHYGFVLKTLNQNLPLAVEYLRRGIDSQDNGTQDGRFYFNLGDGLQRLGRTDEAREVYRQGAALKLFLSEYQRSLYNVDTLKAQAFWTSEDTGYEKFLSIIESNWEKIREEGLNALNDKGLFEDEAENLRDSGDWKQLELFARGQRRRYNCLKAPITCGIIEMFPAARFCRRGQVKFSVMHPGTHIWPHCGPTNCRLRAHLGLKIPPGTLLRVANETRTWQEGKFLIFDDSFEHEVWHNGTSLRLVLIVDVWHPELSEQQRQSLSPI